MITFAIGFLASRLFESLNIEGTDRVYVNGDKEVLNYDLFFPPIAKRLRQSHLKREKLLSNSNNLAHVRIKSNEIKLKKSLINFLFSD